MTNSEPGPQLAHSFSHSLISSAWNVGWGDHSTPNGPPDSLSPGSAARVAPFLVCNDRCETAAYARDALNLLHDQLA